MCNARRLLTYVRNYIWYERLLQTYARDFMCYARLLQTYVRNYMCYERLLQTYVREYMCYERLLKLMRVIPRVMRDFYVLMRIYHKTATTRIF
jgi:hypothetical protein